MNDIAGVGTVSTL